MLLAVTILAISACARVAAQLERPVVVWTDGAHTQPYFVEDAAIDTIPQPVRDEVESALAAARKQEEDFAAKARANGLNAPLCGPGTIGDSLASANPADVLRGVPIVSTGRILAVVSGWNIPRHRVASLVFVRIDEVWKGNGVAAGDVLTLELPFGTLHHRGATWCTEMTGADRIAAGRPILISGRLDLKRSLTFLGTAWPIENDQVLPPHAAPLPIGNLRNSIR